MRVAQRFAGYTLEEADNLRKACGKKIRSLIAAERGKFVAGCMQQGYGEKLGTDLFDIIEPFADYAFNKAHSYGYGLVAYQTAWLKANHPVEYLAALLSSVKDDKDRTAVYFSECRSLGIEVRVPDVNTSVSHFSASAQDKVIVFGLSAVRNVGEAIVDLIVSEREAHGPFCDFYYFCKRVDPSALNKRAIESLAKAGAFDSCGHPRQGLCLVFEDIVDRTLTRRREEFSGISTLFSLLEAEAVEGGRGLLGLRRRPRARPGHRVQQERPAGVRKGDAGAVRERPPFARARVGAAPGRHALDPGRARLRRSLRRDDRPTAGRS